MEKVLYYEVYQDVPDPLGSGSMKFDFVTTQNFDEAFFLLSLHRNTLRKVVIEDGRVKHKEYDLETKQWQ